MAPYMRLRQICLVAPHLEPAIPDIAAIMGLEVCYRDGNVEKYGLVNALLPVDTILLEMVAPFRDGTAAGRFVEKSGGRGWPASRLGPVSRPFQFFGDFVVGKGSAVGEVPRAAITVLIGIDRAGQSAVCRSAVTRGRRTVDR